MFATMFLPGERRAGMCFGFGIEYSATVAARSEERFSIIQRLINRLVYVSSPFIGEKETAVPYE